jgi:hypothetical protein
MAANTKDVADFTGPIFNYLKKIIAPGEHIYYDNPRARLLFRYTLLASNPGHKRTGHPKGRLGLSPAKKNSLNRRYIASLYVYGELFESVRKAESERSHK